MFDWNKTKKHNPNSPTNHKVHREFNVSFPFRNLATKCDLFCFSGWCSAGETQPLESLRSHLVGSGGKASRPWWGNSWLLGRMSDCALHPLGLHRTIQYRWCCMNSGSRVHKTQRTGMWPRRARTLCFFMVMNLGPRRGKEKEPYWEEELTDTLNWDGNKAPEPTCGQREGVSQVFSDQRGKRSRSSSNCGH